MTELVQLSDASFKKDVLESELPVLVDFWAPWCGPCKLISPVVEEISGEYADRLKVGKMNVDENPQIAAQLGIRGIPALILFKGGKAVETIIGAVPKQAILEKIELHL